MVCIKKKNGSLQQRVQSGQLLITNDQITTYQIIMSEMIFQLGTYSNLIV